MRWLVPTLLAACGRPVGGLDFEDPADFEIFVEPAAIEVTTGPGGSAPVQFVAQAAHGDGGLFDLDVVEWRLSNRSVGTLDEQGLFTASGLTGGAAWVTAELDGVEGRAELLVTYRQQEVVGAADPDVFTADPTPTEGRWLYPEDGVNVPRNTPGLRFQWNGEEGATYRVAFRSDFTAWDVYTDQPEYLAESATWARIAATNAGGRVEVTLSVALPDGSVLREAPLLVNVNRMDADGSIIYWSTNKQGLVEIPFGGQATDLFTAAQNGGRCVGCHALSSDGKLAFTYDGGDQPLGLKRLDDLSDIIPYPGPEVTEPVRGNFSTFSPDGRFLLVATRGALKLYDADTGAFLRDVLASGNASHPAWSPDGTRVAFTLSEGHDLDWAMPGELRIAVLEHQGDGRFGAWRVLVDPDPPYNAYYPAWSPDGAWLAFNQSTGDANDDPDARVWVVDADGARPPVQLRAANADGELTNSWPKWAPLPDDDVLWLAFGSTRAYGRRVSGVPQLWLAAFDPSRAQRGEDPSWPAFWLPGQDETTGNHIPVWVR